MKTKTILPLIFTDLDGSLLDHHTYSFEPAADRLDQLKKRNVPVIPNTSKTRAELLLLRQALDNSDPFIVENGAAVYLPANLNLHAASGLLLQDGYKCKPFSRSRRHWLDKIDLLAPDLHSKFHGFSTMSVTELVAATGLSHQGAKLAMTREFNEPGTWLGTDSEKKLFIQHLEEMGAVVLEGGRFLHVGGLTDKGSAMQWLVEAYQQQLPDRKILSIALGDSNNDKDMLENADMSVVIKSPVHAYPELKRHRQVYFTVNEGPAGWVEGLDYFLHQLTIF